MEIAEVTVFVLAECAYETSGIRRFLKEPPIFISAVI
jgi:hypothetical protein